MFREFKHPLLLKVSHSTQAAKAAAAKEAKVVAAAKEALSIRPGQFHDMS